MSRRLLPAVVALVVASALPMWALAARSWRLTASPSTVSAGVSTNINLTVTNTGGDGGGDEIGCVRITAPLNFAIESASIVSVRSQTSGAAFSAWEAVWPGGSLVAFKNPADNYPLVGSTPPIDEAVFRIRGRALVLGTMLWTGVAYDKSGAAGTTNCGSGTFPTLTLAIGVEDVLATPAPTPASTAALTPGPTASPTPTPTPAPTTQATQPPIATVAPTPTRTPTPTPTRSPTPTPLRTATPPPVSETVPPSASPRPSDSAVPSASPSSTPTGDPTPTRPPTPSPEPSPGSSPVVAAPSPTPTASPRPPSRGAQLVLLAGDEAPDGTGGTGSGGGGRRQPVAGMDAVVTAVASLPGGVIAWSYPALALSVPGLLVVLAILGQALGAFAWIPIVRRSLGGLGVANRRRARLSRPGG